MQRVAGAGDLARPRRAGSGRRSLGAHIGPAKISVGTLSRPASGACAHGAFSYMVRSTACGSACSAASAFNRACSGCQCGFSAAIRAAVGGLTASWTFAAVTASKSSSVEHGVQEDQPAREAGVVRGGVDGDQAAERVADHEVPPAAQIVRVVGGADSAAPAGCRRGRAGRERSPSRPRCPRRSPTRSRPMSRCRGSAGRAWRRCPSGAC